ncbi:TetR/AcrR family transcriptional regulator [Streptomyces sp. VRA16 Mangrove soil]|uniref:TetR/AcrR family transcriptional regulator n=1 Tax=Streptomyces sp. VRA16 Mangrove soil TaxID=2817434 RepID=UPI001A9FF836|nr:TetR/AcrR family transcriptional regulator [Streptomyces sp. VRA16 Mangrove soil]MBO1336294.1 TetR/AcrR family transcriptional regulator [Streptomyces sp. VRA16 Mangrove soil]
MPAPITEEQAHRDRELLLDAAERLFYERGIRAAGMADVRAVSGLPLKRIYGFFATKEELAVAMLRRRDERWRGSLAAHVEGVADPRERVLAVFDWLGAWFAEPGFRGCAWINAYGEAGATSEDVLAEVRAHKREFRAQIAGWADAAGAGAVAEAVFLLAEGAMVTAGITGDPAPARHARDAADALLPQRGTTDDR